MIKTIFTAKEHHERFSFRIMYIALNTISDRDGVSKKILDQCINWVRGGAEVTLVVTHCSISRLLLPDGLVIHEIGKVTSRVDGFSAIKTLRRLASQGNFDTIYFRNISAIGIFAVRNCRSSIACEVNSWGDSELAVDSSVQDNSIFRVKTCKRILRDFFLRFVRGRVDCLLPVTNELASFTRKFWPNAETHVFPNGIDLVDEAKMVRRCDMDSRVARLIAQDESQTGTKKKVRVFFAGTNGTKLPSSYHWHGTDKIIDFARSSQESVQVFIAGEDIVDTDASLPPNVILLGSVSSVMLDSLSKHVDVAFGTMALHRKGLNEASPLKLLHYIKLGLPVVFAHQFTNIPTAYQSSAFLQLQNNERNLVTQYREVVDFLRCTKANNIRSTDLLKYVDSSVIEPSRLAFLAKEARKRS